MNARWSANAGSTYQRISRRRTDLSGPPLPTIGRSAEIGQRRSAWSRTERRTCAGRHVGAARPGGPELLLQPREERGDVRGLLGHCAGV